MASSAFDFPNYEILAELGRGTTGIVFKARDTKIDRLVALKCPLPVAEAERSTRLRRFLCEAQLLAGVLARECVPQLYHVSEHDGRPFLAREFVNGDTLEQRVISASISLRDGVKILAETASAIERVHCVGVVHRNLRPSNILIGENKTTKLIGFGWAGRLAGSDPASLGSGVSAEVDLVAMYHMVSWLCSRTKQPVPHCLKSMEQQGPKTSIAEYVKALKSCWETGFSK